MNKMALLRYITLFAVLNVVVLAKPNPNSIFEMDDSKNMKRISYGALYKSTLKFPCKPQPRAFLTKDYIPLGMLGASEILKPNNIILHVCDKQSGCCSMANEVCGPNSSEKVTFEVQAEDIFSKTKRTIPITELFNHTTCKCGLDSPPKRNNDTYDARVDSLTSSGLTNNPNELLLCVASLLYFIYLY